MQEIKADIAEMKSDIVEIKVTLAENAKDIAHHIRRSDDMQIMIQEFREHVQFVNATVKIIIAAGGVLLFAEQMGILSRLF